MGFRLLAEEAVSMDWKKADVDEIASKAADDKPGVQSFRAERRSVVAQPGPL